MGGASCTHKINPFDQDRAPRAMVWRKPGEGLDFGFTARGAHEVTGGSMADFMAAITYVKVVTAAEQYFGRINADIPLLFMNTLQVCLRHVLTQKENCFCNMGIHHKIVIKPDLLETK